MPKIYEALFKKNGQESPFDPISMTTKPSPAFKETSQDQLA